MFVFVTNVSEPSNLSFFNQIGRGAMPVPKLGSSPSSAAAAPSTEARPRRQSESWQSVLEVHSQQHE